MRAGETEGEARGAALHLGDVPGGQLVEGGCVDQHQLLDAVGPVGSELYRHVTAEVDAHDDGPGDPEYRHRRIQVFGLGGDPEVGVDALRPRRANFPPIAP